jgi:hypothetical protein
MCDTCGCKRAESFEAENDNKFHVLMKENSIDNQYGKYDGQEYFEMHISQSQEELRDKVKEYLDDLVSGDGIYEYLEKTTFKDKNYIDDKIYTAQEAEIKTKLNSSNTPMSDLFNLLNEMSEALEGSRGDYGARYSYFTKNDKVFTVSGVNPDELYMAESFDAESNPAEIPKDYEVYNPTGSGDGGFKVVSANFINNDDVVIEAELVEGEEAFGVPNEKFKGVLSKVYDKYDADFDNAPYESFDGALADSVSFPEKEYEIDDRDIYNPERAAMDMIRGNRALREQMEEQGVYVGRHPGYYDDNGRWVELMEHYDDYERIPNWLQGLVGVGLVGGLTYLLTKMSNSMTGAENNTNNTTE